MSAPESPAPGREADFRAGYHAGYDDGADRGSAFRSVTPSNPDSAWNLYRSSLPEGPDPEKHDENCFLAMGGGGMCNCSLSKDPEKGKDLDGSLTVAEPSAQEESWRDLPDPEGPGVYRLFVAMQYIAHPHPEDDVEALKQTARTALEEWAARVRAAQEDGK